MSFPDDSRLSKVDRTWSDPVFLLLGPARARVSFGQLVRDLLEQVHEQQVATILFEATPLDRIARQAQCPVSMYFAPIFQH